MQEKSNFAERLQELLDTSDINAFALSKRINCGHSSIHRYLNGENPSLDNLIKIADYFQCSTDFLLGLTDEYVKENYLAVPPFSERLRFLLKYYNKSAYYLQTHTEIAESAIDHWKKGTHTPTVDSVIRIAKVLDCPVDFVIGRIK
ncbi:MAG: helix-turn-helix domain-containing protein [Corallococcus sp.]|nr:helix-turn-helix domain-containing protein [Corallococcus sp.]MCM1358931.1 helix-turn-helix domain-containing protein [Corallococcus sp.]MCM1394919.1 helix-turn-helix domain-containing protein [Corallococcus sp.]